MRFEFPPHISFHLCWAFIGKQCGQWRETLQGSKSTKSTANHNEGLVQRCAIREEMRRMTFSPRQIWEVVLCPCYWSCAHSQEPQLGSLNQTSGHSAPRLAGSPFTTSQLPAVSGISLHKFKSGIRLRWLIFVIEMDEFSNMHVYSLPYLWASVGTAIHPPAQTFMVHALPWPCAEAHYVCFSLGCSGKHLQMITDTLVNQM